MAVVPGVDPGRPEHVVEVLCEESGTKWEAARDWTIVREIVYAMWSIEAGGPEARDRVSLAIALVKADDV